MTAHKNQGDLIIQPRFSTVLGEFDPKSPAKAKDSGLKIDDRILSVNGVKTDYFHEFLREVRNLDAEVSKLEVLRSSDTLSISYQTLFEEEKSIFQKIFKPNKPNKKRRRMGFYPKDRSEFFDYETKYYSAIESIPAGISKSWDFLDSQIKAFGQMFKGKIKAKDSLGSFITIGKLYGTTWDWQRFWNLTAMLSILLGFINLLPIPALDGGHVMFLLFEVITGVKPSDKVLEYATMAGFILLVMLMLYAIGLDILDFFKALALDYFALFNLEKSLRVDADELKKSYYKLSRIHHPDFHTVSDLGTQDDSLKKSVEVNQGYRILGNFDKRLLHLLELKQRNIEANAQVPQDFLFEMMELNESLDELENDPSDEDSSELYQQLTQRNVALEGDAHSILEEIGFSKLSDHDLDQLQNIYLKRKYMHRLIHRLKERQIKK